MEIKCAALGRPIDIIIGAGGFVGTTLNLQNYDFCRAFDSYLGFAGRAWGGIPSTEQFSTFGHQDMIWGYIRQSRKDPVEFLHRQRAALVAENVAPARVYEELPVGRTDRQPKLSICCEALKSGDTLVVWSLRVLAPNMKRLAFTFNALLEKGVSVKILECQLEKPALVISATQVTGQIFAALSDFERTRLTARVSERPLANTNYRRAGRPFCMSATQLREAAWALKNPKTNVGQLCRDLGISNGTLYKYLTPHGEFRPDAQAIFDKDDACNRAVPSQDKDCPNAHYISEDRRFQV